MKFMKSNPTFFYQKKTVRNCRNIFSLTLLGINDKIQLMGKNPGGSKFPVYKQF